MTQVSNTVHPAEVLADSYLKPKALHRTTVVEEVEMADEYTEVFVDA